MFVEKKGVDNMKKYVKVPLYLCGGMENQEKRVMDIIVEVDRMFDLENYIYYIFNKKSYEPKLSIREVVTGISVKCLKKHDYPRNITEYNYWYPEAPRVSKKVLFIDYNELSYNDTVSEKALNQYIKRFNKNKIIGAINAVNKFNEEKAKFIEISEKRYSIELQDKKNKIKRKLKSS